MTKLPHRALSEAVVGRLKADPATSGRAVYADSAVSPAAAFPFFTYRIVSAPSETRVKGLHGSHPLLHVKAHTRSAVGTGGNAEVFDLMDRALQALTRSPLEVDGFRVVAQRITSADPESYQSGAFMHRDGALVVRFTIDELAAAGEP
jgi:hypothetical protein